MQKIIKTNIKEVKKVILEFQSFYSPICTLQKCYIINFENSYL